MVKIQKEYDPRCPDCKSDFGHAMFDEYEFMICYGCDRVVSLKNITETHPVNIKVNDWIAKRAAYRLTDWKTYFWYNYNAYLKSDQWKIKRRLVLERDNHLCQSCLKSQATEVHHLTYRHVGDEPLFDLTSVCSPCHEKITALDKIRPRNL